MIFRHLKHYNKKKSKMITLTELNVYSKLYIIPTESQTELNKVILHLIT